MSKKKIFFIVLVSIFAGWIFTIFPGNFLEAKISTWPVLNRWGVLNPQAPIVINTRETVRVSDNGDAVQAVKDISSKLSLVVLVDGGKQTVVGNSLNLTSDGAFVTSSQAFSAKLNGEYYIVLNDGNSYKISERTLDPATNLEFFLAQVKNSSPVYLGSSKDLQSGEKIIFAKSSLSPFSIKSQTTEVIAVQNDFYNQIFSSNKPTRGFQVQVPENLIPGEAVVNSKGEVVGIYSGSAVISSDVIKQAQSLFFQNQKKIVRPNFGFSYNIVQKAESQMLGLEAGVLVKNVDVGSPAQVAGLQISDVITSISNQDVLKDASAEEILQNFKPGDSIDLTVTRKGQKINLTLKPTELK